MFTLDTQLKPIPGRAACRIQTFRWRTVGSDGHLDSQALFSCKPLKLVLAYFAEVHINLQTICHEHKAPMILVAETVNKMYLL